MAADWTRAGLSTREATLAEALLEAVAGELRSLKAQVGDLQMKLAAVERQKGATLADWLQGAHLAGRLYQPGHIVQRNRRTYVALVETREQPGASSDWRELVLGQERA